LALKVLRAPKVLVAGLPHRIELPEVKEAAA